MCTRRELMLLTSFLKGVLNIHCTSCEQCTMMYNWLDTAIKQLRTVHAAADIWTWAAACCQLKTGCCLAAWLSTALHRENGCPGSFHRKKLSQLKQCSLKTYNSKGHYDPLSEWGSTCNFRGTQENVTTTAKTCYVSEPGIMCVCVCLSVYVRASKREKVRERQRERDRESSYFKKYAHRQKEQMKNVNFLHVSFVQDH